MPAINTNTKSLTNALLIGCALLALPLGAIAATEEVEVGVTAASVTDATGKPPVSPARDLETGLEVFFNEKISTDENGRAQLLFRDGTSLTVGASSEMTIDEYVYDPATGTGDMVVSISKGIFRVVGGKISKNKPIVFNSPTATVAVRGCIFVAREGDNGFTGSFVYGDFAEVTPKNGGPAIRTSLPGYSVKVDLNQKVTKEKTDQAALTRDLAALEKSAEQPAPAAADEPSGASDQQAGGAQPEDSGQEAASADTGQTDTASQPESVATDSEDSGTTESDLSKSNILGQIETGVTVLQDTGLLKTSTTTSPDDASTSKTQTVALVEEAATKAAADETAKQAEEAAAKKAEEEAAKKAAEEAAAEEAAKKAAEEAAAKKAAAKKAEEEEEAASAIPTAASDPVAYCALPSHDKSKCEKCLWYYSDGSCGEMGRLTTVKIIYLNNQPTLRADAYAFGELIGAVVSSSASSALCRDCYFLNWQRQSLMVSGEAIGLHYWVQGASTTAKDLAGAAGKTATYQGGMIGSVANGGALSEKIGNFRSKVDFGVSHYQVTSFNAEFDQHRFSGNSAVTPNSQPFGMTAAALPGRGLTGLTLNASGYFGGTPTTPGASPREIGGSFNITGSSYSASGVFVGSER